MNRRRTVAFVVLAALLSLGAAGAAVYNTREIQTQSLHVFVDDATPPAIGVTACNSDIGGIYCVGYEHLTPDDALEMAEAIHTWAVNGKPEQGTVYLKEHIFSGPQRK